MIHIPVLDADPDDAGNFRLELTNDSGTAAADFGVKVKGKFPLERYANFNAMDQISWIHIILH